MSGLTIPLNANDPSGTIAETPWDVFNVGLGAASLVNNVRERNWGWAVVDSLGLIYDGVATGVPFLPAGASAGLAAYRAGNTIVNSAQVGIDVARTANIANDAARAASTTGRATTTGTAIHRQVGNTLENGNVLSSSANNFFKGANGATGKQPDLSWGNAPGVWADLTTKGQWGRHEATYGSAFGEGIPLIYEAGKGLSNFSLPTFMGSATTASQYLFGGSSGQAAGGGFLLYPNKSNLNMMRSVYQK